MPASYHTPYQVALPIGLNPDLAPRGSAFGSQGELDGRYRLAHPRATPMSTPASPNDDGLFQASPAESAIPAGVDRRSFFMRNAVIGAAAVMTGTTWTPEARAAQAAKEAGPPKLGRHALPRPGGREEVQRPGDDRAGGVLQGRPRPLEFAHDRADAHHLRLLPALHEAAGRPTGEGHRTEGPPLRQPQRHRQGARHRARLAGGPDRQGAGHGRPAVPRRDDRQAGADLSGEARRQDVQSLARRHHLRRPQGRLPAPEHHDVQAHGRRQGALRAGVLLGRRRVLSSGRATRRPRRASRSIPTRR